MAIPSGGDFYCECGCGETIPPWKFLKTGHHWPIVVPERLSPGYIKAYEKIQRLIQKSKAKKIKFSDIGIQFPTVMILAEKGLIRVTPGNIESPSEGGPYEDSIITLV